MKAIHSARHEWEKIMPTTPEGFTDDICIAMLAGMRKEVQLLGTLKLIDPLHEEVAELEDAIKRRDRMVGVVPSDDDPTTKGKEILNATRPSSSSCQCLLPFCFWFKGSLFW